MMTLSIMYDSRTYEGLTVSPLEDPKFPLANMVDRRTSPVFRTSIASGTVDIVSDAGVGNQRSTDYLALVNHDLANPSLDGQGPCSITFQRAPDPVGPFTTLVPITTVTTERIFIRQFTKATDRVFRLRITRPFAVLPFIPNIGEVLWGERLDFPQGTALPLDIDPEEEILQPRLRNPHIGNLVQPVSRVAVRRLRSRVRIALSDFVRNQTITNFGHFWEFHASLMRPYLIVWNNVLSGSALFYEPDAFWGLLEARRPVRRPLATQLNTTNAFYDIDFDSIGEENFFTLTLDAN